jgi:hypothetical protein
LLRWDNALATAARAHASMMARRNALSHQFPGELDLSSRVIAAGGRFTTLAENIAMGSTAAGLHTQWMNSPPHRRNMLDAELNSLGVAVVERDGQLFAVQNFARVPKALSTAAQERELSEALHERGLRLLKNSKDAREVCTLGRASEATQRAHYFVRYNTADIWALPEPLEHEVETGRYRSAAVGACAPGEQAGYKLAVLLYE